MLVSTFIDYYDEFLDKECVYERLKSDRVSLSDFNPYRYTLILGETCIDFIVRDGEIILGDKLLKFGVKFGKNAVKVRCDMKDHFIYCVCRIYPYKDMNSLNSRKESLLMVVQNMDKELNFTKIPIHGLDSKFWLNINLKTLNLANQLKGEIVAHYLKKQ